MTTRSIGAAAEWRAHWPLALAALVGYSTIGLQSYGISPFVADLEREFGWSRSDVMAGVSVSNATGILLNIVIGMIVDRFGSRRVALTGLMVMTGSFALLATATGAVLNWTLLWVVVAVGVVLVQSTVWMRALAKHFDRSRGFAFAVALSGTSIMAIILPTYATWLIQGYGWRVGFVGVAATWLVVTLPIVFLFFRDDRGQKSGTGTGTGTIPAAPAALPGLTFREGLRTRAFWLLAISFGCFSFFSMTVATNLLPLLTETGISAMEAAGIASIMGLVGIAVRLSVGVLLDRLPGNVIGTFTLLMPVIGASILLIDAPGALLLSVAVAAFGAAIGAEMDVALYLATRHFGLKSFAALFNAVITCGAMMAAIGPFVGGKLHDLTGNYDALLMTIIVVMSVGALAMAAIGKTPREDRPQLA
ncbi:MAG: MFS transporter [Novosphingobium sp.]